jgi:hypothetical protein
LFHSFMNWCPVLIVHLQIHITISSFNIHMTEHYDTSILRKESLQQLL